MSMFNRTRTTSPSCTRQITLTYCVSVHMHDGTSHNVGRLSSRSASQAEDEGIDQFLMKTDYARSEVKFALARLD